MLLINSDKGRKYFERVKENLYVYQKSFDTIFAGNPMFTTSVSVPEKSHYFLMDLDNLSFTEDLKKYGGYPVSIPLWRKVARKIKRFIKKVLGRN